MFSKDHLHYLACFVLGSASVIIVQLNYSELRRGETVRMECAKKEACPVCVCQTDLENTQELEKANGDPLPARLSNETAEELCSSNGTCLPRYLLDMGTVESDIRTAASHHLLHCAVHKSMSTIMHSVMCFLHDPEDFRRRNDSIVHTQKYGDLCPHSNKYHTVTEMEKELNISTQDKASWAYTMITRDPIDRFISGFIDRCIRCDTKAGELERLLIIPASSTTQCSEQRIMKSNNFEYSFEDVHFFPQNWRCQLKDEYDKFIFIRYSPSPYTFMDSLEPILQKQGVSPADIAFLRKELPSGRTIHSTVQSPARKLIESRLRSSPYLMEFVVKMFYHDFLLFNYTLPEGF